MPTIPDKSRLSCVSRICGALFVAIGPGLMGYGAWEAWRSTRAGGWPTTQGTIIHLDLDESTGADISDRSTRVVVRYTYRVAGHTYQGDRLAFGYAGGGTPGPQEAIRRRLAGAGSVAVRYDPADPAVSCLSYGIHKSIRLMLVFGAWWTAFVLGIVGTRWVSGGRRGYLPNLEVQPRDGAVTP